MYSVDVFQDAQTASATRLSPNKSFIERLSNGMHFSNKKITGKNRHFMIALDAICKQLLDEAFVISRIIKVKVGVMITYRDLDYSGYHKNQM